MDTSTDTVVCGIVDLSQGKAIIERTVQAERRHAEVLIGLIAECVAEAHVTLDALAVGVGPGPFTGIRVGIVTGLAYGQGINCPVYPVDSLDALALRALHSAPEGEKIPVNTALVAVTDARRREVYWARYQVTDTIDYPSCFAYYQQQGLRKVAGPEVSATPATVSAPAVFVGCSAKIPPLLAGQTYDEITAPNALSLALVARHAIEARVAPQPVIPSYLRRPDATVPTKIKSVLAS